MASADFAPTDQAREVQQVLEQQVRDLGVELERVIDVDVEAFNQRLREQGLGPVTIQVIDQGLVGEFLDQDVVFRFGIHGPPTSLFKRREQLLRRHPSPEHYPRGPSSSTT